MLVRLFHVVVSIIFLFMLLPVFYVVLSSFNQSPSLSFPPSGFTLDWYRKIPEPFWQSLRLSVVVGVSTAVIATVLGTVVAIRIMRSSSRWNPLFGALLLSPLMVPPLVIGAALMMFGSVMWDLVGINPTGNTFSVIAGHFALALPLVIRSVMAAHAHFDFSIEEAALNLGATPRQVFFKVTLPALMPGITSGAIFAFLLSLDDVAIALFVGSGDEQTLPVRILSTLEYSFSPTLMAISAIVVYGSILLMLIIDRLVGLEKIFGFGRG